MKIYLNKWLGVVFSIALGLCAIDASAQGIPVYDNASFINTYQSLANNIQQLKTQYDQLTNAQNQLKAMMGGRGMESLLSNVDRHYLPPDWNQVSAMANTSQGQYSDIAQNIQSIMGRNAVLTPTEMGKLSPQERAMIQRMRETAATNSAMSQMAYQNASRNVNNIQGLINKIGDAPDAKAIADLSARIQAEQVMLQNDQIKLAQAMQAQVAEQQIIQQQLRERAMNLHGDFETSTVRVTVPNR